MQVKLYASLRQTAGTKMLDMEIHPATTIQNVLLEVTRRYPALQDLIWKEEGRLTEFIHVFVNGVNIHHLDDLQTVLNNEDHVDIFPPVVGG